MTTTTSILVIKGMRGLYHLINVAGMFYFIISVTAANWRCNVIAFLSFAMSSLLHDSMLVFEFRTWSRYMYSSLIVVLYQLFVLGFMQWYYSHVLSESGGVPPFAAGITSSSFVMHLAYDLTMNMINDCAYADEVEDHLPFSNVKSVRFADDYL